LTETVHFTKDVKVDREKGLVQNVSVLGAESANGRSYRLKNPAAVASRYEGRFVNLNHPGRPSDPRNVLDRFGWFENVRPGDPLLRGDFHFNPKHAYADTFAWYAENKPEAIGFSHNADGAYRVQDDGREIIEDITKVRSIDLVADPATTKGLFEHKSGDRISKPAKKQRKELTEQQLTDLRTIALTEDDYGAMGDGEEGSDIAASVGQLVQAIMADDSLDKKAKLKKIGKALDLSEPEEPAEEPKPDENPSEETTTEGVIEKTTEERLSLLEQENRDLKLEQRLRKLCEERSLPFDHRIFTACRKMETDKELVEHVDYLKSLKAGPKIEKPRTGQRAVTENKQKELNPEEGMALLMN
jgi:hypothetical protein